MSQDPKLVSGSAGTPVQALPQPREYVQGCPPPFFCPKLQTQSFPRAAWGGRQEREGRAGSGPATDTQVLTVPVGLLPALGWAAGGRLDGHRPVHIVYTGHQEGTIQATLGESH